MHFRKATSGETHQILKLSSEVAYEASIGYVSRKSEYPSQMTMSFLSRGGYYLVAVEDDIIKGWILLGESLNTFENEMIGFISELYVIPKHRKQQLGYELMRNALSVFKQNNIHKVQLNVFEGNLAKNLYKKMGFQEISTLMEISLKGKNQ
ncbi:GNAT family N-acetyltransferase [Ferdinandcohnia quinoae]|uniref:GNAT family N-acetyltransferase n=1 Tax=Fredinandcohnia quinoae TaxID=2918902 RepID=A0AAW5E4H5_9BACI|nr:GNAT family N-acetyltransferase [Fredinandcohnia sp. SECRCQ15]MCH1627383.1 GNAT family N-acetyltransferase [Fredinandcohnia sp. SECRCQ15]